MLCASVLPVRTLYLEKGNTGDVKACSVVYKSFENEICAGTTCSCIQSAWEVPQIEFHCAGFWPSSKHAGRDYHTTSAYSLFVDSMYETKECTCRELQHSLLHVLYKPERQLQRVKTKIEQLHVIQDNHSTAQQNATAEKGCAAPA